MSALTATPRERLETASVEMLAAPAQIVEGDASRASAAEPAPAQVEGVAATAAAVVAGPGEGAETGLPTHATAAAETATQAAATGEPQPPIEAASSAVRPQRPSATMRSAFSGQAGPISDAYAALSSGLFSLGGLAVRMARSLRAGSARW